jgi:hypothetical protein
MLAHSIEDKNVLNAIQPGRSRFHPMGGTHHCIATAYATVNAVFRHLRSECDLNGGSLTDSDLKTVQADFIDKFKFAFNLFDGIHTRCMEVSHATAPMLFMKGRILSSLLLACTQRAAEYAFRNQINQFGAQWLNLLYDALSLSIGQRSDFDVELRLTDVYIKTSCALGRDLSIEKLLLEQAVRSILRNGLTTFRSADWSEKAIGCLNGEINRFVGRNTTSSTTPACRIANGQMRDFIPLFLQELDQFLTNPVG